MDRFRLAQYTFDEFQDRWPHAPGELSRYLTRGMEGLVLTIEDTQTETLAGYWPIWQAVHVDGVWFSPDLKGQGPGALRSLLAQLFATLQANGVQTAFAMLPPDGPSADQAARLGFTRAPGDMYFLTVPPVAEEADGGD